MPLRSSNEPPIYDFRNPSWVSFAMIDDNENRVECSITVDALRQFEPDMHSGVDQALRAFSAHRNSIEGLASRKFDQGQIRPDGVVRLSPDDMPKFR
jgi:hypothetical protein